MKTEERKKYTAQKITDKQRREFWKHGLNPITGFPPEKNIAENIARHAPKHTLDGF